MMNIKGIFLQWFISFLIKKFWWCCKNENISNKESAEELQKPIIKKCEKRKVYSSFIDNIWGDDFAYMQLITKLNQRVRFLLYVNDIFRKYFP